MKTTVLIPIFTTAISVILGGCSFGASYPAQVTSMNVGCHEDKVRVSHHLYMLNDTETWTAECNGRVYDCNYNRDSDQSNCFLREE